MWVQIIYTVVTLMAFAVIPFGPRVSIFGHETALQLTDLPVAVLYILALSSVGIYGIVLGGWASDETSGRLELLLATPLARGRWVVSGVEVDVEAEADGEYPGLIAVFVSQSRRRDHLPSWISSAQNKKTESFSFLS